MVNAARFGAVGVDVCTTLYCAAPPCTAARVNAAHFGLFYCG